MKVAIIGAGPAGLTAGYHSALNGNDTIIFEANNTFAVKPCGDILSSDSLEYLPFTDKEPWIKDVVGKTNIYYNDEHIKTIDDIPNKLLLIDKKEMLYDLSTRVKSLGVKIEMGKRIFRNNFKKLLSNYDLIVCADGSRSISSGFVPFKNTEFVFTLQAYCNSKKNFKDYRIFMYDDGYGWIFPKKSEYNVGVGRINSKKLNSTFEKLLEMNNLEPITDIKKWFVPIGGPPPTLKFDKIVLVGEAGGLVMPTIGEGNRYAIISGALCFDEDYDFKMQKYKNKMMFAKGLLELFLNSSDEERLEVLNNLSSKSMWNIINGEMPTKMDILKLSIKVPKTVLKFISMWWTH